MASVSGEVIPASVIDLRIDASKDVGEESQGARLALASALTWTTENVTSLTVCQMVSAELNAIVARKKALNERRLSITRPLDQAKASTMELFRPSVETLEQGEAHLKLVINTFYDREERKRQEEERRLREEQRKEQERLQAEAAERRIEAERQAQEKERQAAEAAKAGHAEGQQLALIAAQEVRQQGQMEAEALQQQAAVVPAAIVAETKVAGTSRSEKFVAAVIDKHALIKYVAENPEWLNLLDVNQVALNGIARSQKTDCRIPGVKVERDFIVSARGRRTA